jgi:hypothetical protein
MRYPEVTSAITPSFSTNDALEAPARNRQRFGTIDAARRAATPHIVDVEGLTRADLTKPGQFHKELAARVRWCERFAPGSYEIELISDSEKVTGRRFRFVHISIAALFRLWFETNLRKPSHNRRGSPDL